VALADISALEGKFDHEYLIKYKNMSHMHVQWLSASEIGTYDPVSRILPPCPYSVLYCYTNTPRRLSHNSTIAHTNTHPMPPTQSHHLRMTHTTHHTEAMNFKSKQALNRYLGKLDRGDAGVPEDGEIEAS
jgi:hypothetical protein